MKHRTTRWTCPLPVSISAFRDILFCRRPRQLKLGVRLSGESAMKYGRARPVWNVFSLSAPFLGFVCGVVAGIFAPHMQYGEWGFRVWLAFAVAGSSLA